MTINSSTFPYSEINNIYQTKEFLFLACYSPYVIVLSSQSLNKITEIVDTEVNEIYNLAEWKNYLVTMGNDKKIKFWNMKLINSVVNI